MHDHTCTPYYGANELIESDWLCQESIHEHKSIEAFIDKITLLAKEVILQKNANDLEEFVCARQDVQAVRTPDQATTFLARAFLSTQSSRISR